jgi:hypothetical protein
VCFIAHITELYMITHLNYVGAFGLFMLGMVMCINKQFMIINKFWFVVF